MLLLSLRGPVRRLTDEQAIADELTRVVTFELMAESG
jgi:hypothetical protein